MIFWLCYYKNVWNLVSILLGWMFVNICFWILKKGEIILYFYASMSNWFWDASIYCIIYLNFLKSSFIVIVLIHCTHIIELWPWKPFTFPNWIPEFNVYNKHCAWINWPFLCIHAYFLQYRYFMFVEKPSIFSSRVHTHAYAVII